MPRRKWTKEEEVENLAKVLEENELTFKEYNHLKCITIKLKHKVLEQHKVEKNAGSHAPSLEERKAFQQFCEIKKGPFTPAEDRRIIRNWETFCQFYDWDIEKYKPFLFMRHKFGIKVMPWISNRQHFVQFLANGLPNRTLYSVYHRFKNLQQTHKTNHYSRDEDDTIICHIERNPDEKHKFAELAKKLNRTRASVWRRYRILKKSGLIMEEPTIKLEQD